MIEFESIQERLTKSHQEMPPQLKRAAIYLLDNPGDIATLSMRSVAKNADVSVANFTRLAKEIGFDTYSQLRDVYRKQVQSGSLIGYPERAINLQTSSEHSNLTEIWNAFKDASIGNIKSVFDHIDARTITLLVDEMHKRDRIYLVGMQSSHPFMSYMHYIGGMASPSWRIIGHNGAVLGDDMIDICERDALICLAIRPCANATVKIAQMARQKGALIIGITDSRSSPLASFSDQLLLAPSNTPSFFDSYIGPIAIIEMLVGFYLIGGGGEAIERIEKIEAYRHELGEYWT